jgi:hypothetical protein
MNRQLQIWLAALATTLAFLCFGADAFAQNCVISSATTWSTNQTCTTLTINASQRLTITGSPQITTGTLTLQNGANIYFQTSSARLTVTGTATLNNSSYLFANDQSYKAVLRGGTWDFVGSNAYVVGNVDFDVTNLSLCSNCYINATGYGYGPGQGEGTGTDPGSYNHGRGATHGGQGNGNSAAPYGNPMSPTLPGSGGGYARYTSTIRQVGGAGGGVVRINVSNRFTFNGYIEANGNTSSHYSGYYGGGGAGGSVWVTTNELFSNNSAYIDAVGGSSGAGYGGGGGRIFVEYTTANSFNPARSRVIGTQGGQSGTAGFKTGSDLTIIDGWDWRRADQPSGVFSFGTLHVATGRSGGTASIRDDGMPVTLNASGNMTSAGSIRWDLTASSTLNASGSTLTGWGFYGTGQQLTLNLGANTNMTNCYTSVGTLNLGNTTVLTMSNTDINATTLNIGAVGTLNMTSGSHFTIGNNLSLNNVTTVTLANTSYINSPNITFTNAGNITLSSGSYFTADNINIQATNFSLADTNAYLDVSGRGYGAAAGDGAGAPTDNNTYAHASGGSHGGRGYLNNVNGSYGNALGPVTPGSGGGDPRYANVIRTGIGGKGGGVVRVQVSNRFTFNGHIDANGGAATNYGGYYGGGGAGGSVWVTTNELFSNNSAYIDAVGGTSGTGYGGSGGRVFVEYTTANSLDPRRSRVLSTQNGQSGTGGFKTGNNLTIIDGWEWRRARRARRHL